MSDSKNKEAYAGEEISSAYIDDKQISPIHLEHTETLVGDGDTKGERKIGGIAINTHMTAEERSTAMRLANELDPGPPAFSWTHIKFCLVALVVILNSGDSGYDPTIMSSVNSMYQFHDYFGLEQASAGTGVVFGIYTVGSVSAIALNVWLPDKFGRRWGMFIPNILACTGAIITANSSSMSMFLGGRWLTGFGCSAAGMAAKLYIAEVAPPRSRGAWMGVLNSFYYVGQILASGIAIPFGKWDSTAAWRGPLYLQCLPAGINLIFVLFISESPRWLFAQGKVEQARDVLAKFHSKTGDRHSPLIDLELAEFEENISQSGSDKQFWNFKTLFATRGDRYRFGLCMMVSVWGQLAGNGLLTYFLPVLLTLAGIVDRDRQRELNLVNAAVSMVGALTGSFIIDRVGRRKLFLFSTTCAAFIMLIVGCLLSPAGVPEGEEMPIMRANAAVTFILLFMVFFSVGWTPLQALYPSEILSYQNRAKGLSLQGWGASAAGLINTFGLPPALGAINYIVYLIFFAWDLVGLAIIYVWVVETKQLSLEDMDSVFDAPNPKKRSFELFAEAKERAKFEKEQDRQRREEGV